MSVLVKRHHQKLKLERTSRNKPLVYKEKEWLHSQFRRTPKLMVSSSMLLGAKNKGFHRLSAFIEIGAVQILGNTEHHWMR